MRHPLMTIDEFAAWRRGDSVQIGKYTIKPKRDFDFSGFLIDGTWVTAGWVVVKDGCLATPGAGWDTTLAGARRTVGKLMIAKGDPDVFHGLTLALGPLGGRP